MKRIMTFLACPALGLGSSICLLFLLLLPGVAKGGGFPAQWDILGRQIASLQSLSGVYRDHCTYQQKLSLIQFETEPGGRREKSLQTVRYVVEIGPNARGEVQVQVLSAVDEENRLIKGDQKDPGPWALAQLWEEISYPFFPEKIKRWDIFEIEDREEDGQRAIAVQFATQENEASSIQGEGEALVTPGGEMLRLKWKEIRRLEKIDARMNGWVLSNVTVAYYSPEERIRVPMSINMEFSSKNKPWKGSYRLRFQESGHQTHQDIKN